jgi:hypothetical protein
MSCEKYLQKQIPSKEKLKIRDSCKPRVMLEEEILASL